MAAVRSAAWRMDSRSFWAALGQVPAPEQEVRGAEDHQHLIVRLMSDAAGQLADGPRRWVSRSRSLGQLLRR